MLQSVRWNACSPHLPVELGYTVGTFGILAFAFPLHECWLRPLATRQLKVLPDVYPGRSHTYDQLIGEYMFQPARAIMLTR